MKPNVLKFKNDIKAEVAYCKERGDHREWMHPMYCAYYILKHNLEDADKYIEEDIKVSYKALQGDTKYYFKRKVEKLLEDYAEAVCTDR